MKFWHVNGFVFKEGVKEVLCGRRNVLVYRCDLGDRGAREILGSFEVLYADICDVVALVVCDLLYNVSPKCQVDGARVISEGSAIQHGNNKAVFHDCLFNSVCMKHQNSFYRRELIFLEGFDVFNGCYLVLLCCRGFVVFVRYVLAVCGFDTRSFVNDDIFLGWVTETPFLCNVQFDWLSGLL